MKTNKNRKPVSLTALKLQRNTLDKQNTALFLGMMVMAIVMIAVLDLSMNQIVADAILMISVIAMVIFTHVAFYKIVKRAWIVNDIEREMRRTARAQENAA